MSIGYSFQPLPPLPPTLFAYARPLLLDRIPGPAVGHCGLFWPITTLPVRCGTCGGVALEARNHG